MSQLKKSQQHSMENPDPPKFVSSPLFKHPVARGTMSSGIVSSAGILAGGDYGEVSLKYLVKVLGYSQVNWLCLASDG